MSLAFPARRTAAEPGPKGPATSIAAGARDPLIQALVESQRISDEAAARAAELQRQLGIAPTAGLLRLNAIAEGPLYRFYAEWAGIPLFEADAGDHAALRRSAEALLSAMHLAAPWAEAKGFAVFEHGGAHHLAMRDVLDPQVRSVVERKAAGLGWTLQPVLVTPSQFEALRASGTAAAGGTEVGSDLKTLRELAEEGPTIELVNGILSKAVTQRASDIHIEPTEFNFTVRTRIDGEMVVQTVQPREKFDAVSSRVKILSNLDIAERRLPQDGRINARVNGESFDIRVSVLPASAGESIVLRLLRQERRPTHLADLGMGEAHARTFEAWSQQSNGIVLVTGPTGSGKSTTLYTALELSNDQSRKIITVEDPVEYKIPGITQLQVNADIGFTFASALRSILRHDPDMILVGEIRDEETARIAIQSSLTGHLVYSTLHTNSALGAVTRLVDMGVEPFLIAASLRGLMAQRLVRRLCPQCAVPDEQPEQALGALAAKWGSGVHLPVQGLRRAVGCAHCSGTGFYGRVAIYDLIDIDTATAEMIAKGLGEEEMARRLRLPSIGGLAASGLQLVAEGVTTVAEVIRATG